MSISDSVVLISSTDTNNHKFGTGFVVFTDDSCTYIVTCAHVVRDVGEDTVKINFGSNTKISLASSNSISRQGEIKGVDLAVLKVEERLVREVVKLGNAGTEGDSIEFCGYPIDRNGISNTVEKGLLSTQENKSRGGEAGSTFS